MSGETNLQIRDDTLSLFNNQRKGTITLLNEPTG